MTREEKIDIMYEAILSEMEKIKKRLDSENPGKVQNGESALIQKFDALILKLNTIKIPVFKPDLDPIHHKLDFVITQLTSPVKDDRNGITNNRNNRYSPFSKRRLFGSFSSGITWIFGLLFLCSSVFNYYLFRKSEQYKQSHLKYMFIYFSGNEDYLNELDSIWSIDSLRDKRLHFIEQRKKEIVSAQDHGQNTGDLSKELDNLNLKMK